MNRIAFIIMRRLVVLAALLATCDGSHIVQPDQPQTTGGVCLGYDAGSHVVP